MAISIDWGAKIISVPQADLTFIGGNLYEFDTDQFKKDVAALLDDAEGMAFPDAFNHNTEIVLGGITYARTLEIINGYTITFEDGQYRVRFVGSNNNISDVVNLNQVSLLPQNSAGLISNATPTTIAQAVLQRVVENGFTFEECIRLLTSISMGKTSGFDTNNPRFRDIADTKDRVVATLDDKGNRISVIVDPNP